MQVHDIKAPQGANKRKKIVGRGRGSGHGKTSCRGQKGQNARSGRGILRGLEGGQIPIIRRLPKVGFRSHRPIVYQIVTLDQLAEFPLGAVIDALSLKQRKMIHSVYRPYKILGDGELKHALTVQAYRFSKTAEKRILEAGGTIETVDAVVIKKAMESSADHKTE
jgi:large subunit ribosomal protein L15